MRAAITKLLAESPSQITQNCGIDGKLCRLTASLPRAKEDLMTAQNATSECGILSSRSTQFS
jgi:hypothetical protein